MNADEKPKKFLPLVFDWKPAAVLGTVTGMVMGAGASSNAKVCRAICCAPISLEFGDTLGKRFGLSRVGRGSISAALYMGASCGMVFGVHNWVAEERRVLDMYNSIVAGAATGCAQILMVVPARAPMTVRVQCAVLGSISGALISLPIGWCYMKLLQIVKTEYEKFPKQ